MSNNLQIVGNSDAMNTIRIENALENITVGMTTTINGHVVTRWNLNRYEVDTINRTSCSFEEAVKEVAK